jgi:hypothetical protein
MEEWGKETYFRMMYPVRSPPIVLPSTAGTRCEPALVLEAPSVT